MTGALAVRLAGVDLTLLPDRAIWWPGGEALLVADLHFGKDEALRAAGIPIPPGSGGTDLARLAALVAATAPRRLVVLGDLLHARSGRSSDTEAEFARFRQTLPEALELLLVRGNHDRGAGDPDPALGIEVVEEPAMLGRLRLVHDPRAHPPDPDRPTLAGHLHPALRMGPRRKAACFWWSDGALVLPAFSLFTAGARIHPAPGDRCWIPGEGGVLEVPVPRGRAGRDT